MWKGRSAVPGMFDKLTKLIFDKLESFACIKYVTEPKFAEAYPDAYTSKQTAIYLFKRQKIAL